MKEGAIPEDCGDLTIGDALIFYHTGIDPDTLSDEEWIKAVNRIDYVTKKLKKGG